MNYQQTIRDQMDQAAADWSLGLTVQALGKYEAILRLEETVQLSGPTREALDEVRALVAQVKPEIYLRLGEHNLPEKPDLALLYLRKSHELAPGRWEVHLALGRAYISKEMFREAIGEFQEVLRLAPEESAPAYELLGEVFIAQGRPLHTTTVWLEHAVDFYEKRGAAEEARRVRERLAGLRGEPVMEPPPARPTSMDDWLSSR